MRAPPLSLTINARHKNSCPKNDPAGSFLGQEKRFTVVAAVTTVKRA
jgi:hypothetical protein